MSLARPAGTMYRLTILGEGGVGKTALTIQLCLNQFVETYDPTIEDSYRKRINLDGQPTTLEVLDTAGQEEYTALRDQWIRDGEGFLLVYSITHRLGFSRIKPYYEQILRVKDGEPFGAVLVGNKVDQADERQVSVQEGQQLANELGIPFFESSAKLNINTENSFITAARLTRDFTSGSALNSGKAAASSDTQNLTLPPGAVASSAPDGVASNPDNKDTAGTNKASDGGVEESSAAAPSSAAAATQGREADNGNTASKQTKKDKKDKKDKKKKKPKCAVM